MYLLFIYNIYNIIIYKLHTLHVVSKQHYKLYSWQDGQVQFEF